MRYAMHLGSLFAVTCAAACSSTPPDGGGATLDTRDERIRSVPPPAAPDEVAVAETARRTADVRVEQAVLSCTYRRMQGVQVYQDLVTFDPNADTLWPGALVQTRSLSHGILEPIGVRRAPGDVTITNVVIGGGGGTGGGGAPVYSRTVAAPSNASMQEAIGEILRGGPVSSAARVSYRAARVHSLEEAALKVGVDVGWLGGSVKAKFEGGYKNTQTTFFVDFTQAYYTASFGTPESPSAVFDGAVKTSDLAPYVGIGNPPAYVASVTYGRRLMLKIESAASESEIKAALDAALAVGIDVKAGVSADYRSVLEKSDITVFGLGGSPADLAALTQANGEKQVEAVLAYVTNGATYSPASPPAPLSYTLRYLANNQVARVGSTVDFEVPDCRTAVARAAITVDALDLVACGAASSCSSDLDLELRVRSADGKDLAEPTHVSVNATAGYPVALARSLSFAVPKSDASAFVVEARATPRGGKVGPAASKSHAVRLDGAPGSTAASIESTGSNFVEQTTTPTPSDLRFRVRYTLRQDP